MEKVIIPEIKQIVDNTSNFTAEENIRIEKVWLKNLMNFVNDEDYLLIIPMLHNAGILEHLSLCVELLIKLI